VVDDNNYIRQVISTMVEHSGYIAFIANGHLQTLDILANEQIDLILMDIEMPEVDGFELTKRIRKLYPIWFPIIFLSSNDTDEYFEKGIDAGGDDYLTKPVKQVILSAKLKAMARIFNMQGELELVNKKLELLTLLDPLTQIYNRRGLKKSLLKAWQVNKRQQGELSILMIDIDYFKPYNDHYGHPQGDKCLIDVTKTLVESLNRETDVIARYGGEEFVIILPFTPLDGARFKAKELKTLLEKTQIQHQYSSVSQYVSVSIGISNTVLGANEVNELIKQADDALYQAKANGRNQYCLFTNT